MRHSIIFLGSLFLAFAPATMADTALFNNGIWIVQGATDPATNAVGIAVSVGGVPVGTFSEVKVYHAFTGAGFPQIFSVKGRGAIQPILPPPGEPGGTFYLTGYWDCVAGLIPQLLITTLDIKITGDTSSSLTFTGRVTNLTSMQADDFKLKFLNPDFYNVAVEVSYKLTATRDFCVNQSAQAEGQGFRVARMASNYVSANVNANNLLRYYTILQKYCDCCDCYNLKAWVCGEIAGPDGFLVCYPDRLTKPPLMFINENAIPANTPTLVVEFQKPSAKKINPQGFLINTINPNVENVDLWGNWFDAKPSYTAGQRVGRFKFTLRALTPGTYSCDVGACD